MSRVCDCLVLSFVLFSLLSGCYNILGPTDKLDLQSANWKSMEIVYWIILEDENEHQGFSEEKRTILVEGDELDQLKVAFLAKTIRGHNVPASRYRSSKLTLNDGKIWNLKLHAQRNMIVSDDSNNRISYAISLSDFSYFLAVKNLCLRNEKEIGQFDNITAANIRICTNPTSDQKLVPLSVSERLARSTENKGDEDQADAK